MRMSINSAGIGVLVLVRGIFGACKLLVPSEVLGTRGEGPLVLSPRNTKAKAVITCHKFLAAGGLGEIPVAGVGVRPKHSHAHATGTRLKAAANPWHGVVGIIRCHLPWCLPILAWLVLGVGARTARGQAWGRVYVPTENGLGYLYFAQVSGGQSQTTPVDGTLIVTQGHPITVNVTVDADPRNWYSSSAGARTYSTTASAHIDIEYSGATPPVLTVSRQIDAGSTLLDGPQTVTPWSDSRTESRQGPLPNAPGIWSSIATASQESSIGPSAASVSATIWTSSQSPQQTVGLSINHGMGGTSNFSLIIATSSAAPVTVHFHGWLQTTGPSDGTGGGGAPPGTSPRSPILPTSACLPGQPGCQPCIAGGRDTIMWCFRPPQGPVYIAQATPTWVDPPTAYGYTYTAEAPGLFTEIHDFAPGFAHPFEVSVGGVALGSFGPGQPVVFGNYAAQLGGLLVNGLGVAAFEVRGIKPLAETGDANAFPISLVFNIDNPAFAMQAIEVSAPCGYDINCNGTTNAADLCAWRATPIDLNGDGVANAADEQVLIGFLGASACLADFNCSGGNPTVQDIFDYLIAYFAADPRADFNASGAISVQDVFDFLAAYFTGCT